MNLLYYTYFERELPLNYFNAKLSLLPTFLIKKIKSYRRWQDAHASLFGKLLLLQGLNELGAASSINNLCFTKYGKPYLPHKSIYFNISHSGSIVLCIINTKHTVGIDIEETKKINVQNFSMCFTPIEWCFITKAVNPEKMLYYFWTRKEAIIKADGGGLNIPLNNFEVINNKITINQQKWHLHELHVADNYVAHAATGIPLKEIRIQKLFIPPMS